MRVQFIEKPAGPERLVCDAEVLFDDDEGPLQGLKLVGFSIWRGAQGELYVTLPSRAFGAGSERRYFDFLRPTESATSDVRRVKGWILEQFEAQREA